MSFEINPEILEKIAIGGSEELEQLGREALKDTEELLQSFKRNEAESQKIVNSLFKAEDYAPDDPFSPPENIPVIDAQTHLEMKEVATGQARSLDIAEQVAKNHLKAEKVEGIHAQAALQNAKNQVVYQNIENEGLNLLQAVKAGELISVRTAGVQLAIDKQQILNSTQQTLNEIEIEQGKATIDRAQTRLTQYIAETDNMLIQSTQEMSQLGPKI